VSIPHNYDLNQKLLAAFLHDDRMPDERMHLFDLMHLFVALPPPPDPIGLYPDYAALKDQFVTSVDSIDGDNIEDAFLSLYCHVHGHEAPYTKSERTTVDETGGYWCHAGGISPILRAGPFINKETISADFGAGNGLQCLLFQKLYPHAKSIQFEISSKMVTAGKHLQEWLEIPKERVQWIVGDVCQITPPDLDFIYLYRPVRPEGAGVRFYEKLAAILETQKRSVTIFSVADALGPFLSQRFEVFFSDGHLTCYRTSG
jgi:hypothetical protein